MIMIDENEYNRFTHAVAEFTTYCTSLWTEQKNLNQITQQQIEEHLGMFKAVRALLNDLHSKHDAVTALLTEHEKRLLDIERALQKDTIINANLYTKAN